MKGITGIFVLAPLAMLVVAPSVRAQVPGSSRPAYSPYLNLLRPGNQAINYYGLVRPQQDFRAAVGNLQQQYSSLSQDIANPTDASSGLSTTGHGVQYLNYGRYFPGGAGNRGGRSGGSSMPNTAAAAPAGGSRPIQRAGGR